MRGVPEDVSCEGSEGRADGRGGGWREGRVNIRKQGEGAGRARFVSVGRRFVFYRPIWPETDSSHCISQNDSSLFHLVLVVEEAGGSGSRRRRESSRSRPR